jgi:AbrB family looped-hinge helix DNA binding protein
MPTLKVHYEGWIALPSDLRRELGLSSGDRLEVQLVEGAIVLQPARKVRAPRQAVAAAAEAPIVAAPSGTLPARRGPGRPRKVASSDGLVPPAEAKRPRGRPRKAVAAVEPEPLAPSPGPASSEPWQLRKKADLQPKATTVSEQVASVTFPSAPVRRDSGFPFEERRPFRQVEVRKLGPGRRHNRLQRGMDPTGLA